VCVCVCVCVCVSWRDEEFTAAMVRQKAHVCKAKSWDSKGKSHALVSQSCKSR
jgi:hypothetical protein